MFVVRAIAFVLGLLSATLALAASSQRTFVASTGVDTNAAFNCSLVAPCRGFAAAISVTSPKGEVIVLDSAAYGVIPAITKSIAVTAPAGIYAGISVFSGDGITINASATDTVVLRGLTINGQGGANGIMITNALVVHVENCVIANMTGIGINQAKGLLEIKDTIVRNNGNVGVYVVGPGQANLDRVRLEANNTGLAAEFGGAVTMQDSVVTGSPNIGVLANNPVDTGARVTISRSLISSNNYGIYVDATGETGPDPAQVSISDSTISESVVGVHVSKGGYGFLTRNRVTGNGTGVEVTQANVFMDGNNLVGNLGNAQNVERDIISDPVSFVYTQNNNLMNVNAVVPANVPPIPHF
jgi:hypothetical protein